MKKVYFISLLVLIAGTTNAQSYTQLVWDQLQDAYEERGSGFSLRNYIVGSLDADSQSTWTFNLNNSTIYKFAGVCDEDCSDLDIYIYDSEGNELKKDTQDDDFPKITFSPYTSGNYSVKVTMYSCSSEPCYYGLAIFHD